MRRLMIMVALAGCGDAPMPEQDGGACDIAPPEHGLHELTFEREAGDCGEVRERVRRLDGPSHAGDCVMTVTVGCGVSWAEECANGLRLDGEMVRDEGGRWVGWATAAHDGCSGEYRVTTERVW